MSNRLTAIDAPTSPSTSVRVTGVCWNDMAGWLAWLVVVVVVISAGYLDMIWGRLGVGMEAVRACPSDAVPARESVCGPRYGAIVAALKTKNKTRCCLLMRTASAGHSSMTLVLGRGNWWCCAGVGLTRLARSCKSQELHAPPPPTSNPRPCLAPPPPANNMRQTDDWCLLAFNTQPRTWYVNTSALGETHLLANDGQISERQPEKWRGASRYQSTRPRNLLNLLPRAMPEALT